MIDENAVLVVTERSDIVESLRGHDWSGLFQSRRFAWAGEVNKTGGIGGRPVLVVVGDDANDPAAQLRLVQEMVEQRGVVALAGMPAADKQDASVEYLEGKGVPVAGGVLANPAWGTSPILFPQGMGGQQKLRLLTRAAATSGKTRWAFIGLLESDVDATARASRSRAA